MQKQIQRITIKTWDSMMDVKRELWLNSMYTKKIRTPAIINIAFLVLLLLPLIIGVWVYKASAKPLVIQCQDSFIWYEYNPKLEKRCRTLWTLWTKQILNNK